MSRIIVLCEGETEELAIRHFVLRQWHADGFKSIGLKAVNVHSRFEDVGPNARLFLDEGDVLAVFTLIDLYGMNRVVHPPDAPLDTKVQRVLDWLRSSFAHRRSADLFPHLAVHETEAWLLAEGAALANRLGDPDIRADPQAELRNFQRPPSRVINDLFLTERGSRYQKIRDGRPLFAALKFEPVYQSCRYFRSFYDDLTSVARRQ